MLAELLTPQVRTMAIRTLQTSASSKISGVQTATSVKSQMVTNSSDLFFACDDHSAAAAEKDLRHFTEALDSFLAKAGSNFELELTTTRMVTSQPVVAEQEKMSYNFNLLLARGASFST